MQGLTDTPRAALDADSVAALIFSSNIEVRYGADWLDNMFNNIGDLSPYMSSGTTISFDNTASIMATCSFVMQSDSPMNISTDFVRPWMTLTDLDTGFSAQFYLGVYTLATPQYDNSVVPSLNTFSGYDLSYFLGQPMTDSVTVYAGQSPVAAALDLVATAIPGVVTSYVDNGAVAATTMSWSLGGTGGSTTYTYLEVINTLLSSVGYDNIWFDELGHANIEPYVTPANLPIDQTFDLTAEDNLVEVTRQSTQDLFDVPNQWVFIMDNLTAAPIEGVSQFTYTDNDPNSPGSYTNRQRIFGVVDYVTAVDYPSLQTAAFQQIVLDMSPAEQITFQTGPFPLAWYRDCIAINDPNLANVPPLYSPQRTTVGVTWELPLDNSGDMSWTVQTAMI